MEKALQNNFIAKKHIPNITFTKGLGWGLIGGLAATLIMDLILMGSLSAIGLPPFTCFSTIGSTATHFFSILGIEMANEIFLGVAAHYLIGPTVGAIFGAVLAWIAMRRADLLKKSVILAILYVEILSQPLLVATPILLKMTTSDTVEWFGISFVMHLVYGIVLGVIVKFGLR